MLGIINGNGEAECGVPTTPAAILFACKTNKDMSRVERAKVVESKTFYH